MASRDSRIDVWRGLCLVDVVLVHLAFNNLGFPSPADELIKHYTRFAAGGFVFLAGLTVAVVFGPRIAQPGPMRKAAYLRLWRRAALLLAVDVCAAAALRLLDVWRAFPTDPNTPFGAALTEIVTLQRPGLTGGIFVLYVLLLAATPALFALQRRCGDTVIAAASLALYALAVWRDGRLMWPPGTFPVLYWQSLFVAGFLAQRAYVRLRYDRLARTVWAGASIAAYGLVLFIAHGDAIGWPLLANALPLDFTKTPLQPGALLWYLATLNAVLAVTSATWPLIDGTRSAQVLALLGRHSLLVYTAHVFTEIPALEYVWSVWPAMPVRIAVAAADLGTLAMLCVAIELKLSPAALARRLRAPQSRRIRGFDAALGAVGAVALLLIVSGAEQSELSRSHADTEAFDISVTPAFVEAPMEAALPPLLDEAVLVGDANGEDAVEVLERLESNLEEAIESEPEFEDAVLDDPGTDV